MTRDPTTRNKAQERADRVRAFREELGAIEGDGALELTEAQREGLATYHERLLAALRRSFDVDTTPDQKQMSWGMRIAASIGAFALAAAVFLFFHRFWGYMPTPLQVVVLVAAPLLAVVGMEWCSRREKTLYFTGLLGILAIATFILNLSMLGTIFNLAPSQNAFLLWGVFALLLAYAYGLRVLLTIGAVCLMLFLTPTWGVWSRVYWENLFERPENDIATGLVAFAVPFLFPHRRHDNFPEIYRLLGLVTVLVAVLVLSNVGAISYLPLSAGVVEVLYEVAGFVLAGLAIWIGIRMRWREVMVLGTAFFVVFLFWRLFDWWWDVLPRYLFFLVVGLVAVGLLFLLRRIRGSFREASS